MTRVATYADCQLIHNVNLCRLSTYAPLQAKAWATTHAWEAVFYAAWGAVSYVAWGAVSHDTRVGGCFL